MALLQQKLKLGYGTHSDSGKKSNRKGSSSEEAITELQTAFGMLDRNCDGHVYVDDIHDMMAALGQNVDKEYIKDFIKTVGNGGSSVKEHEFISWMETLDHSNSNNSNNNDDPVLSAAFQTFDKNGDGYISKTELQEGLLLIGENVSERTLDLMMYEADKDRDGLISFQEFLSIMR